MLARLLATRAGLGWWPLIVRVPTGAMLVAVSISKFTRHDDLVDSFDRYGLPWPDASVYLAGTVELVGGILLLAGLLTRVAAGVVAVNMAVALATGGRVDADLYHLGLGGLLLAAAVFLVWSGAGPRSADEHLRARLDQPPRDSATGGSGKPREVARPPSGDGSSLSGSGR